MNNKLQKTTKNSKTKEQFCKNLISTRQQLHLTQKQIADKLNLPVSTYANWEQGRTEPSIEDIYLLIEQIGRAHF